MPSRQPSDHAGIAPENPKLIDAVELLESALLAAAPAGRIPCASIFRIAESQGVSVAETGRTVQRLRIKVTGCQLGCF